MIIIFCKAKPVELVKCGKFYKIDNLCAPKHDIGNKLVGLTDINDKIIFKLMGIKISLKKQMIFSKKKENCKKIFRILGIKFTFKDKKALLDNRFNDLYYKLNQQKISLDKDIENSLELTNTLMKISFCQMRRIISLKEDIPILTIKSKIM